MKNIFVFIILLFCSACQLNSQEKNIVENSDVERFWKAYDMIRATTDSLEQLKIIKEEYIKKGTKGLHAIMEKRNYTAESYIDAIHKFPKFWESVRGNTLRSNQYSNEIEKNIKKFEALYPDLKQAQVFFTIGVLRTGGQEHKGHVLIGSEIAMADSNVVVDELEPVRLKDNLSQYFKTNPIDDLVLLNVHEYVHTQQGDYGTDLLSMAIFEGVAEFVSVLATEKPSAVPAIQFGKKNEDAVRDRFQKEMFSPNWNDWLYNDRENEFKTRDLGYYVGYQICEKYLAESSDKKRAIKEMIELDCSDPMDVREFVNKSKYLSAPYEKLKKNYDSNRPSVVSIREFENKSQTVDPNISSLTINFSKKMNKRFRNFKLGSLGRKKLVPYSDVYWSEDGRSLILQVKLSASSRYQIVIDSEFRDTEGRPIEKYLIEFKTRNQ